MNFFRPVPRGGSRGFGRTPYFDGRIFILSVSGSLKHLSIDTMIVHQLSVFAWLLGIKTMVTLRRLCVNGNPMRVLVACV